MNDKAGVADIAYHLQPEVELYEVLHNATLKALQKKKPFTFVFVDLTDRSVRPGWMSEESLGGADDFMGMSLDLQGSITAVARDIERMRTPMKFFRSMAQFTLCFLRYAIVAIGANQWSWCCTIAHMDMINSIAERERARYGDVAIFVALAYDERRRKNWAERCKRNDASLTTVEKECSVENQYVLEECRMKVWIRVERSGLSSQSASARSELAGGFDGSGSYLAAKEDAAVDAFTQRANEIARMMAKQQEEFLAKQAAMLHSDPTDHGQPKGGKKGKRQR